MYKMVLVKWKLVSITEKETEKNMNFKKTLPIKIIKTPLSCEFYLRIN